MRAWHRRTRAGKAAKAACARGTSSCSRSRLKRKAAVISRTAITETDRGEEFMPIIVTDNCQSCRFTECVSVCPVACFHADGEMVYIDNNACIDCRACIPICPVNAIYAEEDLPDDKQQWIAINAERAAAL